MWQCTSTATGSSTGNSPGRCHSHHQDMPPTVSKNPTTRRVITPLVGVSARARWRASEPSSKDDFGRERPRLARGDGWDTAWYTTCYTPHSSSRASGEKRGVAPVLSLSAGAVRGRRLITKKPNSDGGNWKAGVLHPPLCFWYTPPSVRVPFRSTPAVTPASTPERCVSGRERGASRARLWSNEPARRPGHKVAIRAATVHGPGWQSSECRVARVRLTDVPPYVANSAHRCSGWLVSVAPFPRCSVPPLGVVDGPQVASRGRRCSVARPVDRVGPH